MQALTQYLVHEWIFLSTKVYADPFNDVELDMVLVDGEGNEMWSRLSGLVDKSGKCGFLHPTSVQYTYRTRCSDVENETLHELTGAFEVVPYAGPNTFITMDPVRLRRQSPF